MLKVYIPLLWTTHKYHALLLGPIHLPLTDVLQLHQVSLNHDETQNGFIKNTFNGRPTIRGGR